MDDKTSGAVSNARVGPSASHKWRCTAVLVATIVFVSSPINSATDSRDHPSFVAISEKDGLFQSNVFSITQGGKGFIWMATEAGLYRYDGIEFKIYKELVTDETSLSNDYLTTVFSDRSGRLWIGTLTELDLFDWSSESFHHYDVSEGANAFKKLVKAIFEDQQGMIWVGTNHGLARLDPATGRTHLYKHDPTDPTSLCDDHVSSIDQDRSGRLWIGTSQSGVCVLDPTTETFRAFRHQPDDPTTLSDDHVHQLLVDRNSHVWLATRKGLTRYRPDDQRFERFTIGPHQPSNHNWMQAVYETKDGRLLVGTRNGGLYCFDRANNGFEPIGGRGISTNKDILTLFEDASSTLWVGTLGGGVYRGATRKNFLLTQNDPSNPNSLSHDKIHSFFEDERGDLWVGTGGGGISIFDYRTGNVRHIRANPQDPNALSNDFVRKVAEDRSGLLWVGTQGGGVNTHDRKTGKFTRLQHNPDNPRSLSSDKVYSLLIDSKDTVWVGTRHGLNRYNRDSADFTSFRTDADDPNSISNDFIYSLYEDRSGVLWVGTLGGGFNRFNPRQQNFTRFPIVKNIAQMYETRTGDFWIASGEGLLLFDRKTRRTERFTVADGLSDNRVFSIIEDDDNNLWLTAMFGLSKFDMATRKAESYDANDGLQANEFNGKAAYRSRTGLIHIGGVNGFNTFAPGDIVEDDYAPPVVLTNLLLFSKPIAIGQELDGRVLLRESITVTEQLVLHPDDDVIAFEFAALHFAHPKGNKYAYKLEGFDKDWHYVANRRFASYTNLAPGDYVFSVIAANADEVWNREGASLKITVTAPYWQTWWFYGLLAAVVFTAVFGIHRLRVRRIELQKRTLQQMVEQRTNELSNKKDETEHQKIHLEQTLSELEKTLFELEKTKQQLIDNAHKAGMAEIATGVLHNVGNLVNSINVSTYVIKNTVNHTRLNQLVRANAALETLVEEPGPVDHDKLQKLVKYYQLVTEALEQESEKLQKGTRQLDDKVKAVVTVVQSQQQYATGKQLHERLPLTEVVDEALELKYASILDNHIQVEKRYLAAPVVKLQRHKLVHVLVNLYENAKDAMQEVDEAERRLVVQLDTQDDHAYLKLTDSGCGMEDEELKRVGMFGFTTKEQGHGFGLHSCYNYLTEMNAKMTIDSEGKGKGTTFCLTFPLPPTQSLPPSLQE